ncbi:MAG: amidohydrolase family protein [Bacteroidota bacterium]
MRTSLLIIALLAVHIETISQDYNGPIIDMHVHAYHEGNPFFRMRTHPPTLRGEMFVGASSAQELKQQTLATFKKYNVVKAVVSDGVLWDDGSFDDIILYGRRNMTVDSLREAHANQKFDVLGELAPFYSGKVAGDSSLAPLFGLAEELGAPAGIHVFPGGPNWLWNRFPGMFPLMRAKNADPKQLQEVMIAYPKMKLYIMHGGWPYVDDVKALMYMHSQLYVDVAVLNWILPKEEFYAYLKELINAGFGDKIMFGSDQMIWPQLIEVGIKTINEAPFLSLEQKADIFYNNAARFLELTDEEIEVHKKKLLSRN